MTRMVRLHRSVGGFPVNDLDVEVEAGHRGVDASSAG